MVQPMTFPLYERAVERGVLEGRSALIVAPTATGKSFIGHQVVPGSLPTEKDRSAAYLVPFRSLANEVYDHFHDLLGPTDYRLRISTGDYREPWVGGIRSGDFRSVEDRSICRGCDFRRFCRYAPVEARVARGARGGSVLEPAGGIERNRESS